MKKKTELEYIKIKPEKWEIKENWYELITNFENWCEENKKKHYETRN